MRLHRFLVVALLVGALAPISARAESKCESQIVVFSGNQAAPTWVNQAGLTCALVYGNPGADTRIINPGSDQVSVRWTNADGALESDVPTLSATLDGLGFVAFPITLTRAAFPTGGFVYDSPRFGIPLGTPGYVAVTVSLPGIDPETNCFHTVDSSCPDFP